MPVKLTREELLWVEALESGRYPQGRSSLNVRGKLCCLGVGCEVAIADGAEIVKDSPGQGYVVAYDGYVGIQPPAFNRWLGIPVGLIKIGDDFVVVLNAEGGVSFSEIAARIREYGVAGVPREVEGTEETTKGDDNR